MSVAPPSPYTSRFFGEQREGSRRSANAVVPLLIDLIGPRSVVDVGCGTGAWLAAFVERGVEDVLGIDGDHVDRTLLEIPEDRFWAFDLEQPLRIDRRFDLALSLEVGEHLPADRAGALVEALTSLASFVAFSAAIPGQGGTNHLNEQWPEYWAALFGERGYVPVDCVRRRIWSNDDVEYWYAQNLIVYADTRQLAHNPTLEREHRLAGGDQLSLVHPKRYLEQMRWQDDGKAALEEIERLVPRATAFVLVDDGDLYATVDADRRVIPFLERDGEYWGPPSDGETAIRELERLRRDGAERLVFAPQAFWWLKEYASFDRYLRSNFRLLAEDDRVIAFDLTRRSGGMPALRRRLDRLKRQGDRWARRVGKIDEEHRVQWARVVMNRETKRLVEALDHRSLDALEISGRDWESFGFGSYRSVGFPDYDVCADPLAESAFDIVIAEQVLEHVLHPRKAVANVCRMLRPGGVFLVTTPFLLRVHDHPVDCSRWTETGMRYLLAEAGFDLDGITTGSWGNRACVRANFDRWVEWVPWKHSLRNEPNFAVVVWALAPKPSA